MQYSLVSILSLLVWCSAAWCAEETVLRIGKKSISVEEFEKTAQKLRETGYSHVEELDQQGKQELLDGVIARELLVAEALRRGYDRDTAIAQAVAKSERRALMNRLYEQEAVQASYPFSEADLRAFFAQQQYDVEVLSQHIVCATEEEARLVLELIEEGTPFESLIRPYSLQNIQQRFGPGGWVGWFKIGEVYEGLKVPLATMPIGSVYPDPVQTMSGYHVFRLGERRPVDFAAVREWVEKKALVQSRADDMERYVGYSARAVSVGAGRGGFCRVARPSAASDAVGWRGRAAAHVARRPAYGAGVPLLSRAGPRAAPGRTRQCATVQGRG